MRDYYPFNINPDEKVILSLVRELEKKPSIMASLYAIPYNGTEPTGGDSLTTNLNEFYEVGHKPCPFKKKNIAPDPVSAAKIL